MKKVLIAGGGLAGLSAAVHLASKFYNVTLFDASPKLGGRAYSFKYTPQTDDPKFSKEYEIDNGQHILMGCYKETLNYLNIIESENKLIFQNGLNANFIDSSRNEYHLKTFHKFYPFNLLFALLKYSAIPFSERIHLVKFFLKDIKLLNRTGDLNIEEWLELTGTNTITKNRLWDFISIGALNTLPAKASAKMFRRILRLIFLEGNFSSTIIIPGEGLSQLFVGPAVNYLKQNKATVLASERLNSIKTEHNKVVKVETNKRIYEDFDYFISALPLHQLVKIKGFEYYLSNLETELDYNSIVTTHVWLNNNHLKKKFYGLIDSKIHWVFNHNDYLTTVTSAADSLIDESIDVKQYVINELNKFFGIKLDDIKFIKVIKEKRATFESTNSNLNKRQNFNIKINQNSFFCGDWTNTGLPATIEGAILSGEQAAKAVTFSEHLTNSLQFRNQRQPVHSRVKR